jgi:hypothetical protein
MLKYELEYGGKTVEIDSETALSPDQLKAYAYYGTKDTKPKSETKAIDKSGINIPAEVAQAAGETALSMASGAVAPWVGAVAGGTETLGKGLWRGGKALATGGDVGPALMSAAKEGGATLRDVQNAMTFEPRSQMGKDVQGALAYLPTMASKGLGAAGEYLGREVGGQEGANIGGGIGDTALDIAGFIPGLRALGKGAKAARLTKPVLTQEQDAALRATKDGYMPPPTQANPSISNAVMSTVANADKLADEIAVKNARNTTRIAKEDVNLGPNQYLNAEELGKVKAAAEKKYAAMQKVTDVNLAPDTELRTALHVADKPSESVARAKQAAPGYYHTPEFERIKVEMLNPQVPHTPASLMVQIADLRADASTLAKRAGAKPQDFREAMAMRNVATSLEDFLERKLTESMYIGGEATAPVVKTPLGLPSPARPTLGGPPSVQPGTPPMGQMPTKEGGLLKEKSNAARKTLIDDWKDARQTLAKVHNIEESTNLQTGHVDPAKLKKLRDAGAPLSGNLSKIVDAHEAMGDVVKSVEKGNKSALRASDSSIGQAVLKAGHGMSAAALGAGAGGAVGGPMGALAGGGAGLVIPLAARKVMASKLYQQYMGQPSPTVLQQLKQIDPALAAKAAAATAAATLGRNNTNLPPAAE